MSDGGRVLVGAHELIAIHNELREIRRELAEFRSATLRPQRDDREACFALTRCIAAQVGNRVWSVTELLEHAQVDPDLRQGIVGTIGSLNGKKLGKLFQRIEGVDFDGAMILRRGLDREGVLWLCEFQTRKPVYDPTTAR